MMYKQALLTALATLVFTTTTSFAQYDIEPDISVTCSPVKSQDKTGTCWSFATVSFLESEILKMDRAEQDLSEMYFVRQNYLNKARNYLLRQGKANFSEGSLSHDVIDIFDQYGAMPESAYSGLKGDAKYHNHGEMVSVMKASLDAILANKPLNDNWQEVMNAIMDVYLGPAPDSFEVNGKQMTPDDYADHLDIDAGDYVSITSFTHHDFYEKCILELPDNYSNGSYYNVPLDELIKTIDNALANGYSVAWDGDVSEKGFSAGAGLAVLPEDPKREDLFENPGPEIDVTQELRQQGFESLKTTDDHLMHITGTATDSEGTRYYIIKNSWGPIGPEKGYLYMSLPYLKMKTIAIMVNEHAIPSAISKKISL